ncbi:hypothetical protein PISL3812_05464 [Talaromyces islandicus]|uniref:F-box domain-containing protein n=1 Tax=Talaromyces islandicus TaxID=28573 RepID=A0A0U1LYL8_TALIS|nr:hypothetical protein PISL3812_05464 [Talaromyces islandicus]
MDEPNLPPSPQDTVVGESCHLFNLPMEILDEVSKYLAVPELGLFMRANKQLHEALYPQIIKQAIREDDELYESPFNLTYAAMKDNIRAFEAILEKTKAELLAKSSIKTDNTPRDHATGATIIHMATVHCKPIYLQRLLEKGGSVSAPDVTQWSEPHTPIQRAAKYGRLDNMKVLVAFGADVNDQAIGNGNLFAWTPLHRAMSRRDLEMVSFLISAGADPRVRMGPTLTTTILIRGLDWVEGLELVLEMHRFEEVMIDHALTHAVYTMTDFYDAASCLIKAGARPRYQLLCVACKRETKPTLKSIEFIATLATVDDRNGSHLTALHEVVHADVARVVMQTIPGIVNAKGTQHGWTPLQYLYGVHWPSQLRELKVEPILRKRRSDVALALLQNGASIDFSLGLFKRNVLFSASEMGHYDVVQELLRKDPGLVYSRDSLGNTPLHMAASSWDNGTLECLEILLAGDSDIDAQNDQGQTALHCVSCSIPIPDAPERTFLDNDYNDAKVIALTEANANIFLRGTQNWSLAPRTAVVEAIFSSNLPSAETLVDEGVALFKSCKGSTTTSPLDLDVGEIRRYLTEALHAAVENGWIELVRRLLQPETECSLRDLAPNGDNVFHCLARGAISMSVPGMAMTVGWRMLGYQMPSGWNHKFTETYYTTEGRPQRYFYELADEICGHIHLLPLALEKNAAGHSAFDLYKQAFPMLNWDAILEKIQDSLSKGEDICMPIPYQPTVNLAGDYSIWSRVDI